MSVLRSFNIGISGLKAAGGGLTVIGDNLANASTTGFKASRAEFQDVLATSLKGIDGGDQFGAGTKLAHIKPLFSQGDITRTDSMTDLAINGNGFFVLEADFGRAYSRDGSMHFDAKGSLVNSDGYKVFGFEADPEGRITNKLGAIGLGTTTIPARATKKVDFSMNFDTRVKVMEFNPEKPDDSSNYSNSVTVYDNIGTARVVTLYFNKLDNKSWAYHAMVGSEDVDGAEKGKMTEMANGTLAFTSEGLLQEVCTRPSWQRYSPLEPSADSTSRRSSRQTSDSAHPDRDRPPSANQTNPPPAMCKNPLTSTPADRRSPWACSIPIPCSRNTSIPH